MSNRSWSIYHLLGAAAVGGVIGGLVVALLTRPPAPSATATADPASATEPAAADGQADDLPQGADLETRVGRLEQKLASMRRQQNKRRELSQYARRLAGDDAGAPRAIAVDAEDPGFELAVRTVIDRAQTEREEARQDRRDERRQRWVNGQLDFLTDELGLSDEQVSRVEAILIEQMETFRELRNRDNENRPATRREWRQRMGEIRQKTRTALGDVLSDEQLANYDKLQEEEGWRGPRGGRR